MEKQIRISRIAASAQALGDDAPDRYRFFDKLVLLTGEEEILQTRNGAEAAEGATRLLARFCGRLCISLPPTMQSMQLRLIELATEISADSGAEIADGVEGKELASFDAILSIGSKPPAGLPCTVINSHGWLARVSSCGRPIAAECQEANSIAAFGAACLGATEVFKRLVALRPEKGELLDATGFSFWSYGIADRNDGPALPPELSLDILLAGGGAIGNGIAYLLSKLPVVGRAMVCDRQQYREENIGTCIAITSDDLDRSKSVVLAELLSSKLATHAIDCDLAELSGKVGDAELPMVCLNGLDNIAARHCVQRLWPLMAIDGAIGSDFTCQVSSHVWNSSAGCLLCTFREPMGPSIESAQRLATGLAREILANPDHVLTTDDLRTADPDKLKWLEGQVGKKVCSIVSEAILHGISMEDHDAGFAPSAPFVACFSACLAVAELVRYLMKQPQILEPRYQINLLVGPEFAQKQPQRRRADCDCVTRRDLISRVIRERAPIEANF